jgi:hypothetical protein
MPIPIEFWIIATAMLSGTLGYFTALFFLAVKAHRIERAAWNQARIFYTRKQSEGDS